MGKSFIKGLTSVLLFCFIVVSGSSLSANATTKNKISNDNEPEITTLYADDYLVRYLVSENGYQYTAEFDTENFLVTINDKTYTWNDYQSAAIEEINYNKFRTEDTKNIVEILDGYKTVNKMEVKNELINEISPLNTLPTTGYGPERYVGNMKKGNLTLGITTALLTAAAAFFTKGNVTVTKAFVTKVLKEAASAGIISSAADYIAGGDGYYKKYQAQHKTQTATKERRVPYYQKYSFTSYGDSWTHYFWYAQPINLEY